MILRWILFFELASCQYVGGCPENTFQRQGFDVEYYRYPLNSNVGFNSDGSMSPDYIKSGYKRSSPFAVRRQIQDVSFASPNQVSSRQNAVVYGQQISGPSFALEYTGFYLAPQTGSFTFIIEADDETSLQIGRGSSCCATQFDGLVTPDYSATTDKRFDSGATNTGPTLRRMQKTVQLEAGIYYPIKMLYFNAAGAYILNATVIKPDGTAYTDFGRDVVQMAYWYGCPRVTTIPWTGYYVTEYTTTIYTRGASSTIIVVETPTRTLYPSSSATHPTTPSTLSEARTTPLSLQSYSFSATKSVLSTQPSRSLVESTFGNSLSRPSNTDNSKFATSRISSSISATSIRSGRTSNVGSRSSFDRSTRVISSSNAAVSNSDIRSESRLSSSSFHFSASSSVVKTHKLSSDSFLTPMNSGSESRSHTRTASSPHMPATSTLRTSRLTISYDSFTPSSVSKLTTGSYSRSPLPPSHKTSQRDSSTITNSEKPTSLWSSAKHSTRTSSIKESSLPISSLRPTSSSFFEVSSSSRTGPATSHLPSYSESSSMVTSRAISYTYSRVAASSTSASPPHDGSKYTSSRLLATSSVSHTNSKLTWPSSAPYSIGSISNSMILSSSRSSEASSHAIESATVSQYSQARNASMRQTSRPFGTSVISGGSFSKPTSYTSLWSRNAVSSSKRVLSGISGTPSRQASRPNGSSASGGTWPRSLAQTSRSTYPSSGITFSTKSSHPPSSILTSSSKRLHSLSTGLRRSDGSKSQASTPVASSRTSNSVSSTSHSNEQWTGGLSHPTRISIVTSTATSTRMSGFGTRGSSSMLGSDSSETLHASSWRASISSSSLHTNSGATSVRNSSKSPSDAPRSARTSSSKVSSSTKTRSISPDQSLSQSYESSSQQSLKQTTIASWRTSSHLSLGPPLSPSLMASSHSRSQASPIVSGFSSEAGSSEIRASTETQVSSSVAKSFSVSNNANTASHTPVASRLSDTSKKISTPNSESFTSSGGSVKGNMSSRMSSTIKTRNFSSETLVSSEIRRQTTMLSGSFLSSKVSSLKNEGSSTSKLGSKRSDTAQSPSELTSYLSNSISSAQYKASTSTSSLLISTLGVGMSSENARPTGLPLASTLGPWQNSSTRSSGTMATTDPSIATTSNSHPTTETRKTSGASERVSANSEERAASSRKRGTDSSSSGSTLASPARVTPYTEPLSLTSENIRHYSSSDSISASSTLSANYGEEGYSPTEPTTLRFQQTEHSQDSKTLFTVKTSRTDHKNTIVEATGSRLSYFSNYDSKSRQPTSTDPIGDHPGGSSLTGNSISRSTSAFSQPPQFPSEIASASRNQAPVPNSASRHANIQTHFTTLALAHTFLFILLA